MKKLMPGMLMILSQLTAWAQTHTIKGVVSEKETGDRIANVTAIIDGQAQSISNVYGEFLLQKIKPGKHLLRLSSVGYKTGEFEISITEDLFAMQFQLERINLFLQPVEITGIRATDRMPFAKTNLNKQSIEKMNTGVDLPFIINQTPSVVVNSDAGNGIGYTGIRVRGTDATRINMTLNGIPYNDAESQGLFFVNLPDFASSVNSIQIQRGVGTSSNGAGAFGATLNLSTNEFNEKAYAEVNNGFGSFNSWRHTIKTGTGLINKHFTVDARISYINSDGFIDRASSNLKSFYTSAAYLNKKSSLRLNIFSGKEKTYQAWNGIPEAKLKGDGNTLQTHYQNNLGVLYKTSEDSINLFNPDNNRTYNSFLYKNQTDNYRQTHYQLFFNHELNKNWNFNTAFFLTRGKGYYEEYKTDANLADYGLPTATSDIIRQLWLSNWFYGTTYNLQYKKNKDQFTVGGAYTRYKGMHYGKLIWAEVNTPKDYKWYNSDAFKNDFSVYTKYQRRVAEHWELFADVQYRAVNYTLNGFRNNPALKLDNHFNFINPKLGVSYADGKGWLGFASLSVGNKEPNRDDFEAGVNQQPKHETLYDWELNIERRKNNYSWSVTGYYMRYKNQLVLTGKINDVGAYTRTNIPSSYRAGVELQGGVKPASWFNAGANLTLSENRVKSFTEFIDDYDNGGQKENFFKSAPLAFSPSVVGGATLNFIPIKNSEISLLNKYVSRQFLDNTGTKARSINAFFVTDLRVTYNLKTKLAKGIVFTFQLNNVFDLKYEANGYTYNYIFGGQTIVENFYYPMAGRNFMMGVNVKL
ncbi:MAG: TonB-dependent receptor [Chitinophagaceae bacterium]|nr:TonB-dependent receptor [Chitinophagaceae bacterium]